MTNDPKIIVALDYDRLDPALALADSISPAECRLKIGQELFTRAGPRAVTALVERGFDVFLDLKYHDIPNTVAGACRAAAGLGAWMINVHALGGLRMMIAAREALAGLDPGPLLVGVTVLTSHQDSELREIGLAPDAGESVGRLARLARDAGLDGVVCSGQEAAVLRAELGPDFVLVTPGIRPADSGRDDQRRALTPAEAMARGADYLVVGRPVTRAPDPAAVLRELNRSLESASLQQM